MLKLIVIWSVWMKKTGKNASITFPAITYFTRKVVGDKATYSLAQRHTRNTPLRLLVIKQMVCILGDVVVLGTLIDIILDNVNLGPSFRCISSGFDHSVSVVISLSNTNIP